MKLLDLFCGAGGAAMGYARAGFEEIVGVDMLPQPHYPFAFVQADALEYLAAHGEEFDAIHASPPCQGYSVMHNLPWLRGKEYPLLILPIVEMLEGLGKPYVVENVMGARHGAKGLKKRGLEAHGLRAGWLCGVMFGMPFYRHRLFAANWLWLAPEHPRHKDAIQRGRNLGDQAARLVTIPTRSGNFEPYWREKRRKDGRPKDAKISLSGIGGVKYREGYERVEFSVPIPDKDRRGIKAWPGRRGVPAGLAPASLARSTQENPDGEASLHRNIHVSTPPLANGQSNGAQASVVGVGHAKGWRLAAEAMGIDWMTRDELTQAIPPTYTEFVGRQLLERLRAGRRVEGDGVCL